MASRLREAGYGIVEDPDNADIVIVNTCSFIQAATEESIQAILEACELEGIKEGRAGIIVSGCMPSRYKDDLISALPEVRTFVPCAEEHLIVERVYELIAELALEGSQQASTCSHEQLEGYSEYVESFAYVKISDGCDRFCSYCTIPFIRGRYRSFPYEQIHIEVKRAQDRGAREIVLIAQDTGRWGTDFEEPSDLATLVGDLSRAFPTLWFRLMYIQPEGITDKLINTVASCINVCDYFDIPFQQVNSEVLSSMNRKGSAKDYLALIERIRTRIPQVALRTTLMVGFPGETEEAFDQLKTFVEEAELDYVGLFAFSCEEGTRAAQLPDQLDEETKLVRLQELRDVADAVSSAVISRRIGRATPLLICGQEEDGQWYGRTQQQAPDVDGVTYFDPQATVLSSTYDCSPGTIVSVRIDDTLLYEMEGTLIDERSNC